MTNPVHIYHEDNRPAAVPLPAASIWSLLQAHAAAIPDRPALTGVDLATGGAVTFSYAQLRDRVVQCANYLYQQHGVRAGDHFAFTYDNRPEVLFLSLAGALIGAANSPMDARRDVVERMEYKLNLTAARVFLTHPRGSYREGWQAKIDALTERGTPVPIVVFDDDRSLLDELPAWPATPQFPVNEGAAAVHVTLFTSGTTADPKGAQLTTANLLYNAAGLRQWLNIEAADRFAAILPLHHINSTTFSLATLLAGGTLVLLSEPPREEFWSVMAQYGITFTSIVQKMLYNILTYEAEFAAARDQLVLSRVQIGSDVVDPEAALAFIEQTGIPLHQGWGLTEVAFRATGVPMGLPAATYRELVRRNTIGAAMPGTNVTVMTEDGAPAAEKEQGEFYIRGPIVMAGYLRNPEATSAAFARGWFGSGDAGWYETIDGRQYFFYHSRIKEIIKKGGSLLSPAAIDRALRAHFPELVDACAFGYPSEQWGEDIWLAVTFAPEVPPARRAALLTEIVAAGRSEQIPGLPKFEAPGRVIDWDRLFPDDPIPRTSTLKVQRARLKRMVLAKLAPPGAL